MGEIHLAGARSVDEAALWALRAHAGTRDEPNLVAAIFRSARFRKSIVDALDARWQAIRVSTVFIHKRPLVEFGCGGETRSCELGDALVVYRERLRPGQVRIQAVLLQAKLWDRFERASVSTDSDQHALYRHWPPFRIAAGPRRTIHLPPGDYGRVLGLSSSWRADDVPRVSPRRPTEPGCALERGTWSATIGTLGRALRGLIRFELGERVWGDWEVAVSDVIQRVAPASPGTSFPPGPRGGATRRRTRSSSAKDKSLEWLMSSIISREPPASDEGALEDEDERPMSILLIDAAELE
jgi:hypothetical protein